MPSPRRQQALSRIARLDLEGVSIASTMAAAATLALPLTSTPAALTVALTAFCLPLAVVAWARMRVGGGRRFAA